MPLRDHGPTPAAILALYHRRMVDTPAVSAAPPSPAPSVLRLTAVVVRRAGATILGAIDWSVRPGERWVVLGPNGSGKSTLLQVASTMLWPSDGTVEVLGERLGSVDARALRRRVGYAGPSLTAEIPPELTPLETLGLAVSQRLGGGADWWRIAGSEAAIDAEIAELLARFHLADVMHVRTAHLPYGKQRLVEIALALATKPRILLLDEPAAGIPAGESGELFGVIAGLPRDVTILFIEHDMELVFRFAERITVLVAGRVLTEGPPSEIAGDPRVREVYLGEAQHG
jgi:branched-chain amino acid transport system ATP-binding protein